MVRGLCAPLNPRFRRSVPNGGFRGLHVPFLGVLISGKNVFVFWGLSSVQWARWHVPFLGVLISGKNVFVFWGLSSVQWGRWHVPFLGVLISGNKVLVFWGLSSVQWAQWHVPKTGKLIFRKQGGAISGGAINRCPTHRRFHRSQIVPMHCRMFRALFSAIGR
jgi:hypothetical protein